MVAGSNTFFDVELAIAGLLADPKCASVELPCSLNEEERKFAKKVAQQYHEIKCQSFGLGKDRTMHLFKRESPKDSPRGDVIADSSPRLVSVKNTFIDDWIDNEGMTTDARVVQSMPHNMFGQCLSAERSLHAAPTLESDEIAASTVVANEAVSTRSIRWADEQCHVPVEEEQFFALGAEVIIEGLVKAPSFNGSPGIVQSWDAETGRYNVMLTSAAGGQRWAKIKGENLLATRQQSGFHSSML